MKHNVASPAMKTVRTGLTALLLAAGTPAGLAQPGTAFRYQGHLADANGPLDGHYDFVFSLYDAADAQVGPSITNLAVAVGEGHFGVVLDFGDNSFRRVLAPPRGAVGPGEWLEISVRTNKARTYQALAPRQRLTAVPYASMLTGTLPSSALEGNYTGKVTFGNSANVFAGNHHGDGANLTNLSAGALATGTLPETRLSSNVALRTGGNTFTGNQLVASGQVGVGTITPESTLDVRGLVTLQTDGVANHDNLKIRKTGALSDSNTEFVMSHRRSGADLWLYSYNGETYRNLQGWNHAERTVRFPANGDSLFIDEGQGRVGVGTAHPLQRLHVDGNTRLEGFGIGAANPGLYVTNAAGAGIGIISVTSSSDANLVVVNRASGDLIKGFSGSTGGNLVFRVDNAGQVFCGDEISCRSLMIRGGADLAEPFAMSEAGVQPGAVVVIDPDHPGRLKLSTEPCDPKVAGIVSGAGGVQPGISMIQTDQLEGGRNVALSGRAFALVDATEHSVRPGDLLTTSGTPGHAMKAANPAQAQGAILGKAMTPLDEGCGLVLVLVSLQ